MDDADSSTEDPCVRFVLDPSVEVCFDFRDDGFRQWLRASAGRRLRVAGDRAFLGESGPADGDGAAIEIDVLPLQSADLSDAQSSGGDGERDGEAQMAWHGIVDDSELFRGGRFGLTSAADWWDPDIERRALDDGMAVGVRFGGGGEYLPKVEEPDAPLVVRGLGGKLLVVCFNVFRADAVEHHVAEASAEDASVILRQPRRAFVQHSRFQADAVPLVHEFGEGHAFLPLTPSDDPLGLPDSGIDSFSRCGEPCGRIVAAFRCEREGGGLPRRQSGPLSEGVHRCGVGCLDVFWIRLVWLDDDLAEPAHFDFPFSCLLVIGGTTRDTTSRLPQEWF